MLGFLQDIRYAAFRTLPKNPGLVAVLILCLGLGIGVNATIFGIFNAALLQGPTAVDPSRLVRVEPGNSDQISYPNYRDVRGTAGFTDFALSASATLNWTSGDSLESLTALQVSANFFDLLGVEAYRGRTFSTVDASPERLPRVVVIDNGFWRRFNEDAGIIGQTITLNREPYVIIGVLRRGHRTGMGLYVPDVYVPISPLVSASLENRRQAVFTLWSRLAAGTSREQAAAAFDSTARRLESEYGDVNESFGRSSNVLPVSGVASLHRRGMPSELPILLAAPFVLFGLLLLVACANVAGVLLARGASRRGEIAVRLALGATRGNLVRMLLAECLVLTVLSTAGGLLLATVATTLLTQIRLPNALTLHLPAIRLDFNMTVYALAVSALTCVVCGLVPALQATRVTLSPDLRQIAESGRRSQGRRFLVTAQVSVSVLLLTACLIFLRSLQHVRTIDPGFDVQHGVTARISVDPTGATQEQLNAFALQVVNRLETLPQIRAASFATLIPLGGDGIGRRAELRDQPADKGMRVWVNNVGPKFFASMNIAVRGGREFLETDRKGAAPVIIVNESFARRAFPNQEATGRFVRVLTSDQDNPWREIVGIVSDAKYASLSETPQPQVFLPYLQSGGGLLVQVRTEGSSSLNVALVRAAIADVDSTVLATVQTTAEATSLEFALRGAATLLLAAIGGLGVLLAMVGLFGVLTWTVSRRRSEIGIRMALGASRRTVSAQIVKDGLLLVGTGTAIGLAAGMAVTWPLRGFLAGTTSGDPFTLGAVSTLLLLTGTLASLIPAHRASSIDPAVALRRD